MLSFALTSAGYDVQVYNSGPEALADLLALPVSPRKQILLLGIDLAGIDGHTLHEQLVLARPGVFLVAFLSARWSDADQIRAFTAGAIDYVVKPVSIPVLLARVASWGRLYPSRA